MKIVKESSGYLEMKMISINKEISEIRDKLSSIQKQLDETRREKYNVDLQLEEAKQSINSKKNIWILSIVIIIILSLFSYSIRTLIPVVISVFVVLPIAAYFSKDYFKDLKIYDEQNRIYEEKAKKIGEYDKIIGQYNEELKNLDKKYSDYDKGLIGEKKVTEMLMKLEYDDYLINDVTLDKAFGNIDHILVSRYGIFIIETKNWDGEIVCNEDSWNKHYENEYNLFDIDIGSLSKRVKGNARNLRLLIEAKIFNNLVNVWVEGIIVFANANAKIKIINPTVPVLTIEELSEYIKRQQPPANFSPKDLESIANFIIREAKDRD